MSEPRLTDHTPPRGRREQRKHVTRLELLSAGRRLFGEQGLYESRIEDLSRHAGVAKGTLYGYFANKDELIEAVVAAGFDELRKHVRSETHGARDHAELVHRIAEAHLGFFERNPDLTRIFHQVRGLLKFERHVDDPLRRQLAAYLASLAEMLAGPESARRGARQESLERATLLFGAVSGIVSTRKAIGAAAPSARRTRATTRAIAALILCPDESPRR